MRRNRITKAQIRAALSIQGYDPRKIENMQRRTRHGDDNDQDITKHTNSPKSSIAGRFDSKNTLF